MKAPEISGPGHSGLQQAVKDFTESYNSLNELSAFASAFVDSSQASPQTIRGTGIDHSSDERASDPYFDSHDFLTPVTKLVEIGILHPDKTVSLPYLNIGADKKLTLQAAVFMGDAPESKAHVIPTEMRNGAATMKKMVGFIMQDRKHMQRFSLALDVLKGLHLFQLEAVQKSSDQSFAAQSIDNYDRVLEVLSRAEVQSTESLVRAIYQKLFDKPQTKNLLLKLGLDFSSASDLRDWVETDGFLDEDATIITGRFRGNINREVQAHIAQVKNDLLSFVQHLQQLKQGTNGSSGDSAALVAQRILSVRSPVSERVSRVAMKMNPVITDITPPVRDDTSATAAASTETLADAAPVSEAPETLASPPPTFEEHHYVPIVPMRTVFIGQADRVTNEGLDAISVEGDERIVSPEAEELLGLMRQDFELFRHLDGRNPDAKIGFSHTFEFCNFLLNSDVEIGPLKWENLSDYALVDLFDKDTVDGFNGLISFFRTVQRLRGEIMKRGLMNDEHLKERCFKIFIQLFQSHE